MIRSLFPFVFLLVFFPFNVWPESAQKTIYVILDASGSMWQKLPDGSFRIDAARKVLQDFVKGDFSGHELAFRAYGHRQKSDCRDSELVIPFADSVQVIPKMSAFMSAVDPKGKTPISYSLREALKDLGDRSGEIILISDGEETCDDDPCALMREWKSKDVKIKVHVVGLGLDEKARSAMQCIANAAGTEYRDAATQSELASGLQTIHEQAIAPSFRLEGVDEQGNPIAVEGTLSQASGVKYEAGSGRIRVEPGTYVLSAGVRTKNGSLYRPVSRTVQVAEKGETTVRVQVAIPPSVKAKFVEEGVEQRGSQVTAYQNGKEVFHFRWMDEVYVDEGAYEFRASPNAENELSVSESFDAGEHKEIVFGMTKTVRVRFKAVASGSGIHFKENYELWQGGSRKYAVHVTNGAQVLPGLYEFRLTNELAPYAQSDVVITADKEQSYEITVPVGHVTVIYQKADGSLDKADRCFIGRGQTGGGIYRNSGQKYPLLPGVYNVTGWSHKGNYDPQVFEVVEGQDQEVILRAKD